MTNVQVQAFYKKGKIEHKLSKRGQLRYRVDEKGKGMHTRSTDHQNTTHPRLTVKDN